MIELTIFLILMAVLLAAIFVKTRDKFKKEGLIVKMEYIPLIAGTVFVTIIFGGALSLIVFSDFSQVQLQHPLLAISKLGRADTGQNPEQTQTLALAATCNYNYDLVKTNFITKEKGLELSKKRTIILRMDDVQDSFMDDSQIQIINLIIDNNYALTVGVIPDRIGKDPKITDFVKKFENNPNFEIAQHGFDHSFEEFQNIDYSTAYFKIKQGQEKIAQLFGKNPITFIPPYNRYNQNTVQAAKDLNFEIISAINEFKKNELLLIGENTPNIDYIDDSNIPVLIPSQEIIRQCNNSLNYSNVCVFYFHPQDYSTNGKIDPEKLRNLQDILEGMNELDAEFMTFSQFLENA